MSAADPDRWAKVHLAADARARHARHGAAPFHRRPEVVLPLVWLLGTIATLTWANWGWG